MLAAASVRPSGLALRRLAGDLALWELIEPPFDEIIWTQYLAPRMCSTNIC